ncbi:hypothetical protein ACFQS1_06850 [Paractinoplanes rhizophilus]|jgi:hypothetical protein|uniref:DUF4034 domain-containing protein n=1 Tax=Paractinoplanes rhizophilus TaxID=1416877 RepID=A0ABW2HPC0_9ACTN|nr:hypothetical protein [Actinoplanes sp.]
MLRAVAVNGNVVLDPGWIYPEVAELRKALAGWSWPDARAVLDRVEPAERTELIRIGAERFDLAGFLHGVLAKDPADAAAAAMLGAHFTEVGWRIRTRRPAQFVSREQFAEFHGWLCKAEQVLIEAAARHPEDPAVWVCRLPTARGLSLGGPEARRRYDRLAATDPHHVPGQVQLLQELCPKWTGNWDELHAFAREAMLAAPPGSHAGSLVAEAHIEHWTDLPEPDDQQYLADRQAELVEAAQRSIWHADFRRTIGWVRAAGVFAMAFSLAGDLRSADAAFALLGNFGSERPWDYLGDPHTVIPARRAEARRTVEDAR